MIQVYYGMGKGKTSSLNGMAVRLLSLKKKIKIYRFLKGIETSEDVHLIKMGIFVQKIHLGNKFVYQMNDDEKTYLNTHIKEEIQKIISEIQKDEIILLDEFIDLSEKGVGILSEEEQIDIIKKIAEKAEEIIITGHRIFDKLSAVADLITHFDNKKHYFEKGIKARKGYEY